MSAARRGRSSFTGPATGFWTDRLRYRVTVFETAGGLRRCGTPLAIETEAIGILTRVG